MFVDFVGPLLHVFHAVQDHEDAAPVALRGDHDAKSRDAEMPGLQAVDADVLVDQRDCGSAA